MFSADIFSIIYSIFLSANSRFYWPFLLLYLLIGIGIIAWGNKSRLSPRQTLRGLFPSDIYTHASFRMDLKIWVVSILFIWSGIFSFFLFVVKVLSSHLVSLFLTADSIAATSLSAVTLADRVVFTITVIIVFDFGYFLGHYLSHKVPVLWSFHQVHHAAEHLTPVTSLRLHPVDYLFTALLGTFMSTTAVSAFSVYHGTEVQLITVLNVSMVFFLFQLLANFRHSHIWISYGPLVSKMLVSPCMHQIHHSTARKHIDRNFGFIFSFWDRLFQSRYIPVEKEYFKTGLVGGMLNSKQSVFLHLYLPFCEALSVLRNVIGKDRK